MNDALTPDREPARIKPVPHYGTDRATGSPRAWVSSQFHLGDTLYWSPEVRSWIDAHTAERLFGYAYADRLRDGGSNLTACTPLGSTDFRLPLPHGVSEDMGVVDHRSGFDGVRTRPLPSGDVDKVTGGRGVTGTYRGFPAVILEETEKEFIVAYKRDERWTVFNGASRTEFYAKR